MPRDILVLRTVPGGMLLKQEFKFTNGSKGKEIEFRSVQTIKQNWENNILNKLSLFHIIFHKFLFIKYLFWHFNVFCWYYQNQSLHSNIHHHWCFSFVRQCFITIFLGLIFTLTVLTTPWSSGNTLSTLQYLQSALILFSYFSRQTSPTRRLLCLLDSLYP